MISDQGSPFHPISLYEDDSRLRCKMLDYSHRRLASPSRPLKKQPNHGTPEAYVYQILVDLQMSLTFIYSRSHGQQAFSSSAQA